jgi:hypothetical protein
MAWVEYRGVRWEGGISADRLAALKLGVTALGREIFSWKPLPIFEKSNFSSTKPLRSLE